MPVSILSSMVSIRRYLQHSLLIFVKHYFAKEVTSISDYYQLLTLGAVMHKAYFYLLNTKSKSKAGTQCILILVKFGVQQHVRCRFESIFSVISILDATADSDDENKRCWSDTYTHLYTVLSFITIVLTSVASGVNSSRSTRAIDHIGNILAE